MTHTTSRRAAPKRHRLVPVVLSAFAALAALPASVSNAAVTDISPEPLATRPKVQAKPNLMVILDDSGSMNWSYMPDDLGRSRSLTDEPYTGWFGYWSAQCNGLAYDPAVKYLPPLDAAAQRFADAGYPNARRDGYDSDSSTSDLSGNYYYSYSGSEAAMGWTYTNSGVISSDFYRECSTYISEGSSVFSKVLVSGLSSEQKQNYANWYSFYRKRYLLMRTAMGSAVSALGANYRVGFSVISDNSSAEEGVNYFRDVKDFDSARKAKFYESLYGASPSGGTPLRAALSKAGRYFANKAPDQGYDPVQYSCQRNYALLTTDGYWNGGKGVRLDGSTVTGQQDGTESRPMRDDAKSTETTVTPYTARATRTEVSTETRTRTYTRTSTTESSTKGTNGCASNRYAVVTRTDTYERKQTRGNSTPQAGTARYDETVVSIDGQPASAPTRTDVSYSNWSYTAVATPLTATDNGAPSSSSAYSAGTDVVACSRWAGDGKTSVVEDDGSWGGWSTVKTSNSLSVGAYRAGTPVTTRETDEGTADTLADTAQYYYKTDLRTTQLGNCTSATSGNNVCDNIVRTTDGDAANWQHMTTFTVGLGLSGTLPYDRNYLTQTTGAYAEIKAGTRDWPSPANTQSIYENEDARNIDDLWHAAVNGRGQYYSALNAGQLSEAINGVVVEVQKVDGSASAASTSSLELVAGDNNQLYRASYTTELWTGDLQAFTLNGSNASVALSPTWSAQARLDATVPSERKIYFNGGSSGRQNFEYANLSTAQKGYFDNLCAQAEQPTQCTTLSASDKTLANNGSRLVDYLRGVRTYEAQTKNASDQTVEALYRKRAHVLGDIINGAPVHVGKPPFSYGDAGYADFVRTRSTRKPVVYVAANDGMLHAFSAAAADGGSELWAYVPNAVMPKLYKLADAGYASRHQYLVDGAPVMGDIKVGDNWKTILVGGLGGGGRSYYALDITDPADPKPLWEFTDANLGDAYGNPVITKKADGTWIVAFASGYNNTTGDGKGRLFVLNANTGAKLLDIPTTAGSTATPSGLSKINAWIDSASDNTSKRFYGGDLLGNLWRFDIDNLVEPHGGAMLLTKFQIDANTPQPITTKPETAEISGKPVVIVGTGRYLGVSDITDATRQSIYAVKDTMTETGWGDVRSRTTDFVQQSFTLSTDDTSASVSDTKVDWALKGGWWIDLPHNLERVSSNLGLQFDTLAIATAIPNGDACASGGQSWRYYLNIANGGVVTTNPAGVKWGGNSLIVGMSWVKDANGNVRVIYQNSDGTIASEIPPTRNPAGAGSVHRSSWRELTD